MSERDPVTISERQTGMIALRAALDAPALDAALRAVGGALPGRRRVAEGAGVRVLWFSPDELLLLCAHADAPRMAGQLDAALAGTPHLVWEMSDARALYALEGAGVREVLARGAPVDLSPEAFGPGDLRRTRMGQVAVAFWCVDESRFELVCFRSVASYVREWLETAAGAGPVGVLWPATDR